MSGVLDSLYNSGPTLGETFACASSSWTLVGEVAAWCVMACGIAFTLLILCNIVGAIAEQVRK